MNNEVQLIALPNLFVERGRIQRAVCPGRTIAQHLADLTWDPTTLEARVSVDGRFVEKAAWQFVVPRVGQILTVRMVPTGVGGRGGSKNTLRIVAMLAVVALAIAAPYIAVWAGVAATTMFAGGGLTLAGTLLSTGVGVAGMLAMNARIP